jgi:ribosomal protein S18 acetylase RimI-like enzyme
MAMAGDSAPSFRVRAAAPADVAARGLAESEDSLHAMRAGVADWLRDGVGPGAGFTAFVAEAGDAATVIGMATCSQRVVTGWNGPVLFLQDLFVEAAYRHRGIARALVARIAALAREISSPIIELTVRADNPVAQEFYRRNGFRLVPQCLTYMPAGPALGSLADCDDGERKLAFAS